MAEDPSDMAADIIDSIEEDDEEEDALTPRERGIELTKEQERIRKAKELKRQLRKRELGLLHYRWPAVVLILSGIMAIWTQFQIVMIHPEDIGFDTFWDAFLSFGNPFFIVPMVSGGIMIILGILSYTDPRVPFISLIPAMLIAMAGAIVYYLISFALAFDPEANVAATGTPISMFVVAILCLLAIAMRERE
ncbi:MAG: hypothetical protein RTU92_05490 [Candidatus Thorarchaeota archaeon]